MVLKSKIWTALEFDKNEENVLDGVESINFDRI